MSKASREDDDQPGGEVIPIRRNEDGPENLPAVPEDAEVVHVDDDQAELVPVDQGGVIPGQGDYTPGRRAPLDLKPLRVLHGEIVNRPILSAWVVDRDERRDALRFVWAWGWRTTAYHAARVPLYASKVAAYSPMGGVRAVRTLTRWVVDAEGDPLRQNAVNRGDVEAYLRLSQQRNTRVKIRLAVAALTGGSGVAGLAAVGAFAPDWATWVTVAVLVAVAGKLGAPADRPLITTAVLVSKAERLTSEHVIRALGALGIAEINKALGKGGPGITFPSPITRDGPGWRADVDLPYGITATDVMERRSALASGLRRTLGCVWPGPAPDEHEGRLVLWVGDVDMNKAKAPPWPLAKGGQADLFKPVPFGTDQRGRLVSILLMFANVLIGAMPRQGKTFALRVLLLAAALDPIVEMRTFELKGTGDLSPLAQVSHHYASGPDDATIEACVVSLREVYKDLERRAKVISGLPKHLCPENKVTPQLAARRELGLHPVVVAIDECQELFSHPDFKDEAERLAVGIIKRGPAMGVILILATQRPDSKSLPTGVSANVGIRFCLRVMGQVENDMVLGTSMYRNGIRATTFTNRDKGIGYLAGVEDDPIIARGAYLDGPASERIAERARLLREAAGNITGHAAGEAMTQDRPADLLEHVAGVFGADDRLRWEEIADRLALAHPDTYGGWTGDEAGRLLRGHPYGLPVVQVSRSENGTETNRRGATRDAVNEALRRLRESR